MCGVSALSFEIDSESAADFKRRDSATTAWARPEVTVLVVVIMR
jgi:hypothetical protein